MNHSKNSLLAELKSVSKPTDHYKVLRLFYSECDTNTENYFQNYNTKIACQTGCSYCCFLRVSAGAQEIFLIADFIRKHFSNTDRDNLKKRLQLHQDSIAGLSRQEHRTTNIQCPLLVDNKCSVYSVRPFSCRRYHSIDASSCKYSFDNPKDESECNDRDIDLEMWWQEVGAMFYQAYESMEFDTRTYEIGIALCEALKNPKSEKRWRAKKKAFLDNQIYK
jgi:Fe-S-cluster containining protein